MNNDEILSEISCLDDFPNRWPYSHGGHGTPNEMRNLVRVAMQLELARAGQWRHTEDLDSRVAVLESRVERMICMMANLQRLPSVQYVVHIPTRERLIPTDPVPAIKAPALMSAFYALGLLCTVVFAGLLALSSIGWNIIHPFLSLLGLIGGLGWLTTAWADLLLWKREKPLGKTTEASEQDAAIAKA
jgi:hypothetical protein